MYIPNVNLKLMWFSHRRRRRRPLSEMDQKKYDHTGNTSFQIKKNIIIIIHLTNIKKYSRIDNFFFLQKSVKNIFLNYTLFSI